MKTGVAGVLELLERHDIETGATKQVAHYHEVAADSLRTAVGSFPGSSTIDLDQLIRRLDVRSS